MSHGKQQGPDPSPSLPNDHQILQPGSKRLAFVLGLALPGRGLTGSSHGSSRAHGTALHAATLGPATYARTDERGVRWADLEMLARGVHRQRYCRDLLYRGTPELTHTAVHTETGIAVKVRPDLLVRSPAGRRLALIDFKTTSCRSQKQFLATIEQYDYDRQAAFYCDVLQADRFLMIGVQKKAPHKLWTVEVSANLVLMHQGRKKYQALLRECSRRHYSQQVA